MKITATKEEYDAMLFALSRSTECPVVNIHCCPVHSGEMPTCEECMTKNIEWEVVE